ncbi:NADH:ubiquinone oxidoreductase subunit 6 (chain J) [Candidatus Methanoperedens nitroreducens]|uniref:NADH:ubiquinone oxidoreductase subunit 6 (Chain J) n=1 Tax=Candidatus Methanoperedens nitratireducens TaxID=1392998 RepID=A0A062V9Z5_9EURY|nr:NADH-quinone oxidoreductase subunit J [Candidatus Methanoperedens nitroreducens]KCZ72539.1 NADH:ubiquinone oxidoreductase subunit 6 (chain J) [Candidatus Methanoperedens nitroreducens]MDJ1423527.1 NADH-quinone oxidoreductase subunit J [Candidatus Methanoperedens sp.]
MVDTVFLIISIFTIFSSIMVILSKKIVHSAVYLAGSLIGTAGLFILLKAEFVAWVQVLVYVGAVVTLILFTIMLTGKGEDEHAN